MNISSQGQGDIDGEPAPKEAEVYMAVWDQDGHETIIEIRVTDNGSIPLVAIDARGLMILQQFAQKTADKTGETVSIICFTGRQLYASYPPSATGD